MSKLKTPELDKLAAVREKSQAIGEFMDSLSTQGLYLCEQADEDYGLTTTEDATGDDFPTYVPTRIGIEKILAGYFDINMDKCEEERRAILASLQQ